MASGLRLGHRCSGRYGDLVPTPLYGGDGRFTSGVLRLEAENWRGDSTGGDPVMASMDSGEGLGLGPERPLAAAAALLPAVDSDADDDADSDATLSAGFCSRTGGGVRGDRGGGDGRGDRGRMGERRRGTGECAYGDCERGERERGRRCSSSRRRSSASSSRRLRLASSVTRCSGAEGRPSPESSEGGDGDRWPRSGGHSVFCGWLGAGASGSGLRARADR